LISAASTGFGSGRGILRIRGLLDRRNLLRVFTGSLSTCFNHAIKKAQGGEGVGWGVFIEAVVGNLIVDLNFFATDPHRRTRTRRKKSTKGQF
jgi:hypothetical protein